MLAPSLIIQLSKLVRQIRIQQLLVDRSILAKKNICCSEGNQDVGHHRTEEIYWHQSVSLLCVVPLHTVMACQVWETNLSLKVYSTLRFVEARGHDYGGNIVTGLFVVLDVTAITKWEAF
jgi:hypothetical protein